MCSHEDRECPGASCRCECMNCMFPDDEDEDAGESEAMARYASEPDYYESNADVLTALGDD